MVEIAYGYVPDDPDPRDQLFSAPHVDMSALPSMVDLRAGIPTPPWNQSTLGSCTGQSIGKMLEFVRHKQGLEQFKPSPLFIYYNERVIEGTVPFDRGAQIRNGLKSVGQTGVCPEEDWPYEIKKFAVKPTNKAYANALIHRAIEYQRVEQTLGLMKTCLAEGYPFAGGFKVFQYFESLAKDGMVRMPRRLDRQVGGHAVMFCGYNDSLTYDGQVGMFIVCNSWSIQFGDKGFFYIPYTYIADPGLASDFWTARLTV